MTNQFWKWPTKNEFGWPFSPNNIFMLYCALFWYCAFIKYIPLLFSEIPQILFQYLFAALSISRLLHKYIPKDERDSKARKCFLLGYDQGTKGYQFYNTNLLKVFYSWDAKFCENDQVLEPDSNNKTYDYHCCRLFKLWGTTQEQPTNLSASEPIVRRSEWESNLQIYGESKRMHLK